jgi:uncharacterized membrane protein
MTSSMASGTETTDNHLRGTATGPKVKHITMDDPWAWLAAGWQDLLKAPVISLSYGAFFLLAGWLLLALLLAADMWFLVLPMAAGFMLIGPVLAVGLYEVSRAHEHGEKPSFSAALLAWRREAGQLGMMCVVLVLLHLAWVLVAIVLFALFLGQSAPTLERIVGDVFFQPESVPFLFGGTSAGAILALVVFSVSAVSIPMIVDRQTDAITAILTSLRAVQRNWQAMFLWAGLIVIFTAAGIATLFVGLAITLPLIGYATWHAYRAVVE